MENHDAEKHIALDPAQQDLVWAGYDVRATAPFIGLAAFVTVLVLSGRWYLVGLSQLADRVGALAVFALAAAVWPLLIVLILHRTITYTYRLTDRNILVDFGYFSTPVPPIPLSEVVEVRIGEGWLSRWLEVGSVEVQTSSRTLRMTGVRNPRIFAERIRGAVAACRR